MRLKIHFSLSGKDQYIPFNYQYPISCWIYQVLSTAAPEFTNKLHEAGYNISKGKQFKLFTFSKLRFPKGSTSISKTKPDLMKISANIAYITLAFQLPEQTEHFIAGLFINRDVVIGNKHSVVKMKVEKIEILPTPEIKNTLNICALSPVVMGYHTIDTNYEQYILPTHNEYPILIKQNLKDKVIAAGLQSFKETEIDFIITNLIPKTAMQTIKEGTKQQTKVRGYFYDFSIKAPTQVIEIILNSGIGSMNSLGFGYCEIRKNIK